MSERVFSQPTRRSEWPKAGERCESQMGAKGRVLKVREFTSHVQAKVQWDNGSVGYHTITTIRRVDV